MQAKSLRQAYDYWQWKSLKKHMTTASLNRHDECRFVSRCCFQPWGGPACDCWQQQPPIAAVQELEVPGAPFLGEQDVWELLPLDTGKDVPGAPVLRGREFPGAHLSRLPKRTDRELRAWALRAGVPGTPFLGSTQDEPSPTTLGFPGIPGLPRAFLGFPS